MEPLFFKAENMTPEEIRARLDEGFNGAAFFQSGKCCSQSESMTCHTSLQWSRFFSKRKIRSVPPRGCPVRFASMEPLFFKAENRIARLSRCDKLDIASMEPLFFKAENDGSGADFRAD